MGIARLLVVGVAILALLALVVVGVIALVGALSSDGAQGAPAGSATLSTSPAAPPPPVETSVAETPTVYVECRADRCPIFVRVSGGDIVEDRDLSRGQQAFYSQPSLDVVLADASTVYVEVNGEPRSPGRPGERQHFTARRDG
ncbi:hypothetical protein DQ384_15850 [Sphaerisporangium album]|uniref:DUF4115 domain-containing protein n=2 Tax=Sphaerisporangium album TaxID=509200 RepID=A0A367FK63_9ACTN|nr:hypothetical protein DQ384_15850 [Sphaerisporangium album]